MAEISGGGGNFFNDLERRFKELAQQDARVDKKTKSTFGESAKTKELLAKLPTAKGAPLSALEKAIDEYYESIKWLNRSIERAGIFRKIPESYARALKHNARLVKHQAQRIAKLGFGAQAAESPEKYIRVEQIDAAALEYQTALSRYKQAKERFNAIREEMRLFSRPSETTRRRYFQAEAELKSARIGVEAVGGRISKFREFTDDLRRTVLRSRWAFLTLSTITAIVVSRIIGYLMKLASTIVTLPWNALKKGVRAFYDLGKAVLTTRDRFRQYEIALNGVLQSSTKATQISKFAKEYAAKYPAMYEDIMKAFTLLAQNPQIKPFIREADTQQLKEFMDIIQMLAKLNPEQGVAGARFAISEAFAGNFRSLMMRFNLPAEILAGTIGKKRSDLLNPKILLEALKAYTDLNGGARLLAASANTLQTHLGNLVDKWKQFLDVVGRSGAYQSALDFFKRLDELWGKLLSSNVAQQFGAAISAIIQKFSVLGQKVLSLFPEESFTSLDKFKQAIDAFVSYVSSGLDKVEKLFTELYISLSHILVPMFVDLGLALGKAFFTGLLKAIFSSKSNLNVEDLGPGIPDFSTPEENPYARIVKNALKQIKIEAPKIKNLLKDLLDFDIPKPEKPKVVSVFDEIKEKAKKATEEVKKFREAAISGLGFDVSKLPKNVQESMVESQSPEYALAKRRADIAKAVSGMFLRLRHEFSRFGKVSAHDVAKAAYKEVRALFENKPMPIRFQVPKDLFTTISDQINSVWNKVKTNVLGRGVAPEPKDIQKLIELGLTSPGKIVQGIAKRTIAEALGKGELGLDYAQKAIQYLRGTFSTTIEKTTYEVQQFLKHLTDVSKIEFDLSSIENQFNKVKNVIDSFNQSLYNSIAQFEKLNSQKVLIDVNRAQQLLNIRERIEKAKGKPFDFLGKAQEQLDKIMAVAKQTVTPEGGIPLYQSAAQIITSMINRALSQGKTGAAEDLYTKLEEVTARLANLQKETLTPAIQNLAEKIKENTETYQKLMPQLTSAMQELVNIGGLWNKSTAATEANTARVQSYLNNLYQAGAVY